jgi:quinol-cytochrome oxidoreductase complex cytochrome b subunit
MRKIKTDNILRIINGSFYDGRLPKVLNNNYTYGSMLGISIGVQIVTGVILSMYYKNSTAQTGAEGGAFTSIEKIMREIKGG